MLKDFFIFKDNVWSISIFKGSKVTNLEECTEVKNPVISYKDINDIRARFVADPFIIKEDDTLYMFFEVLDDKYSIGRIGVATSTDGCKWEYKKIVLSEEFHLSYPYVFKYNNKIYMIPECGESGYIRVYEAAEFPYKWRFLKNIIKGRYLDPSILEYKDTLYIFANKGNNLHLFYSKDLLEGWKEHPKSPIIVDDKRVCRPGGRIIKENDKIFRYSQDISDYYGKSIKAFQIMNLSENEYEEIELNIEYTKSDIDGKWNKDGMHNIDALKIENEEWLAVVDGHYFQEKSRIINKLKYLFFTKFMTYMKNIFKLK